MPATGTLPDLSSGRAVRYAPTYAENEALLSWLRTEAPEDVLEPELPIVDCHHHFWDLRGKLYDDYDYGPRGQVVYGLDECLEDMCDGHRVTHTGESAAGRPANSCSSAAPTHQSISQSVKSRGSTRSLRVQCFSRQALADSIPTGTTAALQSICGRPSKSSYARASLRNATLRSPGLQRFAPASWDMRTFKTRSSKSCCSQTAVSEISAGFEGQALYAGAAA
jgi:hypothetical protein